jgi:Flp pilus assembly protein TadD
VSQIAGEKSINEWVNMMPLRRTFIFVSWLGFATACGTDNSGTSTGGPGSAGSSLDSGLMAKGVDLLYQKNDPIGAQQVFRQVLQQNPNHYGAHYQLAAAVDRAGRPAEARPMWQDVLKLAESVNDTATIRLVRARLAAPDTIGVNQIMVLGLNLLYGQNNPTAAADEFRKVLTLKPTHYGATYQLAVSLDRSGKHAEARPIWTKMLAMATAVKDQATADTARARLKQNP